jgi:hypothetical protein
MTASLARVLGGERRVGGWLLFQSGDGDRRRLSPYPDNWMEITDWTLERWCMRATRVPPAPARRDADRDPPA